jgi:alkylation response protein AidB-like acyl-CoA dehydrogenase
VFADLAGEDLSLARLAEGHADAVAILAELDGPRPGPGSRWGVWAAHPPGPKLEARRGTGGWRLSGTKRYCSGARACTHALVTATAPDGTRLFAVEAGALTPVLGSWPATGMAGSDTLDVDFGDVPARPVGMPGAYIERPGFAHGGVGVAACWYGGARAVGQALLAAAGQRDVGPHALAHLGAVDIALRTVSTALDIAADEIDADPADLKGAGPLRALRVRALADAVAGDVLDRTGRALGAGPLCLDGAHSRRVADLTVYIRQHHAERSLAELGAQVAEQGTQW